jgi:hypothetical protein
MTIDSQRRTDRFFSYLHRILPQRTWTDYSLLNRHDGFRKAAVVGLRHFGEVLVSETKGEKPAEVQEAENASVFGKRTASDPLHKSVPVRLQSPMAPTRRERRNLAEDDPQSV